MNKYEIRKEFIGYWRDLAEKHHARADKAEANYQFMVNQAADRDLPAYREFGEKLANTEARAEAAEARVRELEGGKVEAVKMQTRKIMPLDPEDEQYSARWNELKAERDAAVGALGERDSLLLDMWHRISSDPYFSGMVGHDHPLKRRLNALRGSSHPQPPSTLAESGVKCDIEAPITRPNGCCDSHSAIGRAEVNDQTCRSSEHEGEDVSKKTQSIDAPPGKKLDTPEGRDYWSPLLELRDAKADAPCVACLEKDEALRRARAFLISVGSLEDIGFIGDALSASPEALAVVDRYIDPVVLSKIKDGGAVIGAVDQWPNYKPVTITVTRRNEESK